MNWSIYLSSANHGVLRFETHFRVRYYRTLIFGAVCLARGTGAALVLPNVDKHAMTLHLAEIGRTVTPSAHAVVTVDGAGWHRASGKLKLPGNVSTLTLPAYSPELNPQENIWQYLRQNYLINCVFDTYELIGSKNSLMRTRRHFR